MSVIFGIVEKTRIIVAGDKRATSQDGELISDDMEKVIIINKRVCLATAGNASIAKAIMKRVEGSDNQDNLLVEDIIDIIKCFYAEVVEKSCDVIYGYPFKCIIAGKGRDGKPHLYSGGKFKSGFEYKEVPVVLFSPVDASQDDCNKIFMENYKRHPKDFYKRIVKDISQISKVVGASGNVWVYGFGTSTGKISEF